jgi:hypothetical protein
MFENVRFMDISRINIEKFITFLHVYRMIFDKYTSPTCATSRSWSLRARGAFRAAGGPVRGAARKRPVRGARGAARPSVLAQVGHPAFGRGVRAAGHHRVQAAHRVRHSLNVRLVQGKEVRHAEGVL